MGISTQLWVVKDVVTPQAAPDAAGAAAAAVEIEVMRCMSERQAKAHARLLEAENKGRRYEVAACALAGTRFSITTTLPGGS